MLEIHVPNVPNVLNSGLLFIRSIEGMKTQKFIRKVQFRQGSLALTIPREAVLNMGIERGQYAVITPQEMRLIVDLIPVGGEPDALQGPAAAEEWDAEEQATARQNPEHDDGGEPSLEGFRM